MVRLNYGFDHGYGQLYIDIALFVFRYLHNSVAIKHCDSTTAPLCVFKTRVFIENYLLIRSEVVNNNSV